MTVLKILFLHGWHSTPGGRKPQYLIEHGHQVANPALCPDDFEKALAVAQESYESQNPDVVIGSSRGGALAMNLKRVTAPLVLMCPAWKNWGDAKTVGGKTLVLHSRKDEVIPFEHSQELLANSALAENQLIEVGKEHRLASPEALDAMLKACLSLV